MKNRRLESNSRMKYLLGNNPIGELVKVVTIACKKKETKKSEVTF